MSLGKLIEVARGDAPADLVLRNAQVVNVLSAEVYTTDVAVWDGRIVGLGAGYAAEEELDLDGAHVAPGFIDAHIHIESTMLTPPELARVVVPHGTTTIVSDPHEIANVLGVEGVRYMLDAGQRAPLDVFITVPSCVPATHMETAGAVMTADDMAPLLREEWVAGIAEMMNFPGVAAAAPDVVEKLEIAGEKRVDGHAPGLSGQALNAYVAAGIRSDHECTTLDEAREKLRLGMHIMVREGSVARNMEELLPLITPENARRFIFVTDDITPLDLLAHGHIDGLIRQALGRGLDPMLALQMATLNPAQYFGFEDRGAVTPGRRADLVVFDDFERFNILQVYRNGELSAENGEMLLPRSGVAPASDVRGTMNTGPLSPESFVIPAAGRQARVVGLIPNQIVTRNLMREVKTQNGYAVADPERDMLKLAVVERHTASGAIGLGFIEGFELQRGAIAGSVAHDHHNLIVAGASDDDMYVAAQAVVEMGGGLAVADGGEVAAQLALPVAGLMSDQPGEDVGRGLGKVQAAAEALGCRLEEPFMALSFLGLEVIPELKLTDQGLVDVAKFEFVMLFVEE
ncbi:MAG: Adenine deaminase [Anaerolineales bacterium]|nr:Adenine deaminase [Anaerolineales bacterium]